MDMDMETHLNRKSCCFDYVLCKWTNRHVIQLISILSYEHKQDSLKASLWAKDCFETALPLTIKLLHRQSASKVTFAGC